MDRYFLRLARLFVALLLAGLLLPALHAQAADDTIVVNSTADAPDADLADGECLAAPLSSGRCTLRAAIMQANINPGHQTILLEPARYALSIPGAEEYLSETGSLDIRSDMTIALAAPAGGGTVKGQRAIIDATGLGDRAFTLLTLGGTATIEVRLRSLEIVGGDVTGADPNNDDPIIDGGGGLYIDGHVRLALEQAVVARNKARLGGGMFVSLGADVRLDSSQVRDNVVVERAFEDGAVGGGIYAGSHPSAVTTLRLDRSIVSGNTAGLDGGGIYAFSTLVLHNTLIADNHAGRDGGGLFHQRDERIVTTNSAFVRNTAGHFGGGIRWDRSVMTMTNATISSNRAMFGGGLARISTTQGPPLTSFLQNVTIAGNLSGGGIGVTMTNSQIRMINSIVANNAANNCSRRLLDDLPNSANLISDGTCTVASEGNQLNVDAMLGPLAFNGGTTPTHALRAGSPAIDNGVALGCPSTDQRGSARQASNPSANDPCDLGAFEASTAVVGTFSLGEPGVGASASQTATLGLTWEHPVRWRALDTVELQLRGEGGTPLLVRYTEGVTSTEGVTITDGLALYNSDGTLAGAGQPGTPGTLESDTALLDLASSQVQGSGPEGKQVTLTLVVRLKQPTEPRYTAVVLATDDTGALQGPDEAGTITFGPFLAFLPLAE